MGIATLAIITVLIRILFILEIELETGDNRDGIESSGLQSHSG
jgi:hypothetical protein